MTFGSMTARETDMQSRVETLLAEMTLDEKLSFVHGRIDPNSRGQAGYIPGVPRLGIPELRLTDGPAGIHVAAEATALPAPVMLASAFDDDLAYEYGRLLGREGREHEQHVLLSPMTNLIRTPFGGRNFETFSEDPVQSARLVARQIAGIQDEGLMATVKHFAINNQEKDRQVLDVRVDERTLREAEFLPFQAAVDAGVAAVMGAYNKVNGTYACENPELLNRVLRDEWGFDGWVMSDWRATHSTEAIVHGLDQEMPLGVYFDEPLREAIRAGDVPEGALDESVRRILGQMSRFGLLDSVTRPVPADNSSSRALAQHVAERGAVLLRNENGSLPLSDDGRRVAVIGGPAVNPVVGGSGSSQVHARAITSPLEELRRRAPETTFDYYPGLDFDALPVPVEVLQPPIPASGISLGYAEAKTFTGTLTVTDAGFHQFVVRAAQSIALLTVGDTVVLRGARDGGARGGIHLEAGEHSFSLELLAIRSTDEVVVEWVTPTRRDDLVAQAVSAAAAADAVLLFAFDWVTEGWDRPSLSLPFEQDFLIDAVSQANPNTTVILYSGSGITMPWIENVRSILQMYFPGEAGSAALTRILYGDVDPGGRLTQTFPRSEAEHPVAGNVHAYPGVDRVLTHSEGVDIGYRWYDRTNTRALFPFGHGLSYSQWEMSAVIAARGDRGIEVEVDVRNTGQRPGTAVPQVYVERLDAQHRTKHLAAYATSEVPAGGNRVLRMAVDQRALREWDAAATGWIEPVAWRVTVGWSATDIVAVQDIDL